MKMKYKRFINDAEKEKIKKNMQEEYIMIKNNDEIENDNVNHPKHYEGNIECIDAMKEVISEAGLINFCIGNAFKYIWRCMKKHNTPVEDLKKARWYISKAIELLTSEV
jgi:hypothetical protein